MIIGRLAFHKGPHMPRTKIPNGRVLETLPLAGSDRFGCTFTSTKATPIGSMKVSMKGGQVSQSLSLFRFPSSNHFTNHLKSECPHTMSVRSLSSVESVKPLKGARKSLQDWSATDVQSWLQNEFPEEAPKFAKIRGGRDLAELSQEHLERIIGDSLTASMLYNAVQKLKEEVFAVTLPHYQPKHLWSYCGPLSVEQDPLPFLNREDVLEKQLQCTFENWLFSLPAEILQMYGARTLAKPNYMNGSTSPGMGKTRLLLSWAKEVLTKTSVKDKFFKNTPTTAIGRLYPS